MPTDALPAGVTAIPLRSPPLAPAQKNLYYVAIRVLADQPGLVGPPLAGHSCQVDTGSCGIVVPEAIFYENGDVNGALLPGVVKGDAAKVVYQPSSDDLVGFYYTVPRLAVGVAQDGSHAFVCNDVTAIGASNMGLDKGMMGVGFGRPQMLGTNVFLNAPGMADGSVHPSFLMTPDSITLGYSQATLPAAGSYGFQQLQANPSFNGDPRNRSQAWLTPTATVTLSGNGVPCTGTALLDTGLNLMMLGLATPDWQSGLTDQTVTVSWPGGQGDGASILSYSMTVTGTLPAPVSQSGLAKTAYSVQPANGTPAGMMPSFVEPIHPLAPAPVGAVPTPVNFVNTGINVILGANFFFDAKAGCIGFARASAA